MRHINFFLISLFMILSVSLFAEQSEHTEQPVPNPLELKQGWWKYFEVPDDQLKEKLQAFKKDLTALKNSLKDQTHQEIHTMIDQVFFMLDLFVQKKGEVVPSKTSELQLLKSYSVEQLLEVQEKLQKAKLEIEARKTKIKTLQSRVDRAQAAVDRSIIHYQTLRPSTFEKLKQGMLVIQQRVELALQNLELQREKERLAYVEKERDQLREELSAAKERLILGEGTQARLNQGLNETESSYHEARNQLFAMEQQGRLNAPKGEKDPFFCCLIDNQILSQSIKVENLKVEVLIDRMKQALVRLKEEQREGDFDRARAEIADWKKQLESAQELHHGWERQIQEDQSQVSRMTAQAIKEEGEGEADRESLIGEIHLELDKSLAELEQLNIQIENGFFLSRLIEGQLVEKKSFLQTGLISFSNFWYNIKEFVEYWTQVTLFRVKEEPVTLMTLISALFIFFIAIAFSYYLRKLLVKRSVVRRSFSSSTEYIVLRLIHYAIIAIGLFTALSFIGLDFTNLAIVAGALGVGIGFGLQTIVSNISSGFMLLLKKYLKVGDVIELVDQQFGTVTAVNLQNTIIRTFDGAEVMIPNSQLSSQRLTNWTMKDNSRRFRVPFGVAYGTDKELVRETVTEAIKKLPFVHTDNFRYPDPQVWLTEFGDSSLNFELVAWVDLSVPVPYETSKSALMWELDAALEKAGIKIPFPQRDLHIISREDGKTIVDSAS